MLPIEAPGVLTLVKTSLLFGHYELRAGTDVVGRLTYAKLTGKCQAEAADQEWTFGRPRGVVHPHQTVTSAGVEVDVDLGVWHRGGTAVWDGAGYAVAEKALASTMLTVAPAGSVPGGDLFTLTHAPTVHETKATVVVRQADPHLAFLVLFACNVMLQAQGGFGGAAVGGPAVTTVITS